MGLALAVMLAACGDDSDEAQCDGACGGSGGSPAGGAGNAGGGGGSATGGGGAGGGPDDGDETIQVVDDFGVPLEGIVVWTADANGAVVEEASTGADGRVAIDVPPDGWVGALAPSGIGGELVRGIDDGATAVLQVGLNPDQPIMEMTLNQVFVPEADSYELSASCAPIKALGGDTVYAVDCAGGEVEALAVAYEVGQGGQVPIGFALESVPFAGGPTTLGFQASDFQPMQTMNIAIETAVPDESAWLTLTQFRGGHAIFRNVAPLVQLSPDGTNYPMRVLPPGIADSGTQVARGRTVSTDDNIILGNKRVDRFEGTSLPWTWDDDFPAMTALDIDTTDGLDVTWGYETGAPQAGVEALLVSWYGPDSPVRWRIHQPASATMFAMPSMPSGAEALAYDPSLVIDEVYVEYAGFEGTVSEYLAESAQHALDGVLYTYAIYLGS